MKKLLFYTLALTGTMILFLSFGFLPTDCSTANANNKSCTVAGITDNPSKLDDALSTGSSYMEK